MTPRDHSGALDAAVRALRACGVVAIGAYGSTAGSNWTPSSDVDLVAVLEDDPAVESIRLRIGGVPVDVNLRSPSSSTRGLGGAEFVPEMVAVWDPDRLLERARTTAVPPEPTSARGLRYLLAHSLDKMRQLEPTPLARLFAGGEGPHVVMGYYRARGLWFPGPVQGLRMLAEREPALMDLLLRIPVGPEPPSTYFESAAELALEPIGGLWRDDEVFVVGWAGLDRDEEGERWAMSRLGPLLDAADEQRRLA